MSDTADSSGRSGDMSTLPDAVRTMRDNAADRFDANAALGEVRRARLEILADELNPVFADVPADDPQFDFVLSSGLRPRLWIDATAHVTMARDARTYRFLRDSRLGRSVVLESTNSSDIAEAVTQHIAERMVERQRMLDGPVAPLAGRRGKGLRTHGRRRRPLAIFGEYLSGLLLVIFGIIAGIAILLVILSDLVPELGLF